MASAPRSRALLPGLGGGSIERLGAGVSGIELTGADAGPQLLVVAGHEVPVERLALRDALTDPPGLIGMDVLRGTVVAAAADPRRSVFWQV